MPTEGPDTGAGNVGGRWDAAGIASLDPTELEVDIDGTSGAGLESRCRTGTSTVDAATGMITSDEGLGSVDGGIRSGRTTGGTGGELVTGWRTAGPT